MKYNLSSPDELEKAVEYLSRLSGQHALVDIKKVNPNRSLSQNSFLHLLIGAFGEHFGYTLAEAKTIYKRDVNPDIYVYTKNNAHFLRSSADLDKDEMTKSIDKFRQVSEEAGYPLPLADDKEFLRYMENTIEQAKRYM